MPGISRTLFTVTDCRNKFSGYAESNQVLLRSMGTPFSESQVIFVGTALITMPLNLDRFPFISAKSFCKVSRAFLSSEDESKPK